MAILCFCKYPNVKKNFKELATTDPCEIKIERVSDMDAWICIVENGSRQKKGFKPYSPDIFEWTFCITIFSTLKD